MQPSIIRDESKELIRVSKEKGIKETICNMGFLKALELVGMPRYSHERHNNLGIVLEQFSKLDTYVKM